MERDGHAIFVLGAAKFDSPIESTSFTMAKYLARKHRVYYIDYPFTWKDCITLRKTGQYRLRKHAFFNSGNAVQSTGVPGLKIVILPPVASINFLPEGRLYRYLLKIIEHRIREQIRKVISAERIKSFIYINSFNFHYPGVATGLSPELTVYHCVDPLVVPYDRRHGVRSEEQLVKQSDLVICTSKQLWQEKSLMNPNTHFIPNAADTSHSQKALEPELPVHPRLKGIRKPVIGYFGNIERRIDFHMLQEVVAMNRNKSFVFAGPYSRDELPAWLFAAENVHLTGRIPYDEMPAMIKGFDVALIPFKKDQYSRTIFPLKLFEYLGAGKPVVATDFNPDLKEFTGSTVSFAACAPAFSSAIARALQTEDPSAVSARLSVARANTWEQRVTAFEEILNNSLS